jgi:hypothetical protein
MIGKASEVFLFIVCVSCLIVLIASVSGCTTTSETGSTQPKSSFIKIDKSKF